MTIACSLPSTCRRRTMATLPLAPGGPSPKLGGNHMGNHESQPTDQDRRREQLLGNTPGRPRLSWNWVLILAGLGFLAALLYLGASAPLPPAETFESVEAEALPAGQDVRLATASFADGRARFYRYATATVRQRSDSSCYAAPMAPSARRSTRAMCVTGNARDTTRRATTWCATTAAKPFDPSMSASSAAGVIRSRSSTRSRAIGSSSQPRRWNAAPRTRRERYFAG